MPSLEEMLEQIRKDLEQRAAKNMELHQRTQAAIDDNFRRGANRLNGERATAEQERDEQKVREVDSKLAALSESRTNQLVFEEDRYKAEQAAVEKERQAINEIEKRLEAEKADLKKKHETEKAELQKQQEPKSAELDNPPETKAQELPEQKLDNRDPVERVIDTAVALAEAAGNVGIDGMGADTSAWEAVAESLKTIWRHAKALGPEWLAENAPLSPLELERLVQQSEGEPETEQNKVWKEVYTGVEPQPAKESERLAREESLYEKFKAMVPERIREYLPKTFAEIERLAKSTEQTQSLQAELPADKDFVKQQQDTALAKEQTKQLDELKRQQERELEELKKRQRQELQEKVEDAQRYKEIWGLNRER